MLIKLVCAQLIPQRRNPFSSLRLSPGCDRPKSVILLGLWWPPTTSSATKLFLHNHFLPVAFKCNNHQGQKTLIPGSYCAGDQWYKVLLNDTRLRRHVYWSPCPRTNGFFILLPTLKVIKRGRMRKSYLNTVFTGFFSWGAQHLFWTPCKSFPERKQDVDFNEGTGQ